MVNDREVAVGYIGGSEQGRFVERIRNAERERLLAVPIDVGKRTAAALVCDFWGEIVTGPFEFDLNESGFTKLRAELARAEAHADIALTRVGVEQAGHYHDTLVARLQDEGLDVVVLSPSQVKENRSQNLLRSVKTDARDLAAMAELMIRGLGRRPELEDGPIARQAVLVAHRRRKVKARRALKNQVLATWDLVFPGLDGCFSDILSTKIGKVLLAEAMTPARVQQMGPERFRTFCANRGVVIDRAKTDRIFTAARLAFALPDVRAQALLEVLRVDAELMKHLDTAIEAADQLLAEVLGQTPAKVLTSIPHIGVVRASNYGGAVGEVARFTGADQVYKLAGLVPKQYESAGRRRGGLAISRAGKVELREAIIELGKGLRLGHPDFGDYARRMKQRGKPGGVILCAVGHRANRLAFAMMRDQVEFDPARWPAREADGTPMPDLGRPPSK
ncbi:MAG: IS110 family transposase [Actinomycetota bacterium]